MWAGRLVSLQIHAGLVLVVKIKRIEIIDQKVPRQKDIFAPVLSEVPGQMTRCPCGFGAYAHRFSSSISINIAAIAGQISYIGFW